MLRFAFLLDSLPAPTRAWVERNYVTGLRIVVVIVAANVINRYSGRIVKRLMEHVVRVDAYSNKLDRERRLKTLTGLMNVVVRFIVWILAIILIITLLGINAAPIFVSAGLIGAGFAFGAQSLIKDFLSGVFIISENQYRVGDIVDIMGVSGTVQSIGLRTTVLRDLSGSVHHIPNGSIVVTTNKTVGYGQINLDITVAADTDVSLLEHQINHAGQRLANRVALKEAIVEAPHFARISELNGIGMTVKIVGKTMGGMQLDVKSALLIELKKTFDEYKIKLAVPMPAPAPKKKK